MRFRYILPSLATALFLTYAVPLSASSIAGSFTERHRVLRGGPAVRVR
jgi:hypothetical protein